MKTIFFSVILVSFSLSFCQNNKTTNGESKEMVVKEDKKTPSDCRFDGFIYQFSSDSNFQVNNISFPLKKVIYGKETLVEKKEWKYNRFYNKPELHDEGLIIYDDTSHFGLDLDSTIANHELSFISNENLVKFKFIRNQECWPLRQVEEGLIENEQDDFLPFLGKFAADSIFQKDRTFIPLKFLTYVSDSITSYKSTIDYIPKDKLSYDSDLNKCFIQGMPIDIRNIHSNSKYRQIRIYNRGGLLLRYFFEKKSNEWMLIKYEYANI